jgi:hypothetical protein
MPPSAHLETLLRSLQIYSPNQATPRLLSSAAYLLTILSNPLNISLLTSQVLHAPALWTGQEDLRYCLRVMGTFQAAAAELVSRDNAAIQSSNGKDVASPPSTLQHSTLDIHEWLAAIAKGSAGNGTTTPWKQLLVLGGLLIGFEGNRKSVLTRRDRRTLVAGLVAQLNAAATVVGAVKDLTSASVVSVLLNYTFGLLEDSEKMTLDWNVSRQRASSLSTC